MNHLRYDVKIFSRDELYSNIGNSEKTERFRSILNTVEELKSNSGISQNEKDYILSQLYDIGNITEYNIPVVKQLCSRFSERFNRYYNIDTRGDVLV